MPPGLLFMIVPAVKIWKCSEPSQDVPSGQSYLHYLGRFCRPVGLFVLECGRPRNRNDHK